MNEISWDLTREAADFARAAIDASFRVAVGLHALEGRRFQIITMGEPIDDEPRGVSSGPNVARAGEDILGERKLRNGDGLGQAQRSVPDHVPEPEGLGVGRPWGDGWRPRP